MNPASSGRMYCTVAALWSPKAPAISRVKQATQIPMLPGLPQKVKRGARIPTAMPVRIGPLRDVSARLKALNTSIPPFLKLKVIFCQHRCIRLGSVFKRFVASGKGGFCGEYLVCGQLQKTRSSRPIHYLAARRTNARIKGLSDARMRDPHSRRASLATKRSFHERDLLSCTNYQVDDSTKSGDFVNCRYYQKLSKKSLKSKNKQFLQEIWYQPLPCSTSMRDHFHSLQEVLIHPKGGASRSQAQNQIRFFPYCLNHDCSCIRAHILIIVFN